MNTVLFRDKEGKIDKIRDKEYIIERVLKFGSQKDFDILKEWYSDKVIIQIAKQKYYNLDDLTRNYLNAMYDLHLPLTKSRNELTSRYSLRFKKKVFTG